MRRLLVAGLLLFGAATVGCSETADLTDQQRLPNPGQTVVAVNGETGSADGQNSNNQTPNMGGNQENPSQGSQIRCPELTDYKRETPEEAALEQACDDAHYRKEIDFQPLMVEIGNYTGGTAVGRVVGYSETCDTYCPGEVQITYDLYLAGEFWEARDKSTVIFEPSDDRQAQKSAELEELAGQVVLNVTPLNPKLNYIGNFFATVTTTSEIKGLDYRLLVDFPTGETDIIFAPNGLVSEWLGHNQEFYETYDQNYTKKLGDNTKWIEMTATIKAYKVIIHQELQDIEGDWVYFNQ